MQTQAYEVLELEIKTQKKKGVVQIKLLDQIAPKHVERIKQLVADGEFTNLAFHRVIPGFMAQTGDVQYAKKENFDYENAGRGGSQYPNLYAELSSISYEAGVVGMARNRYINSANSQFFIMTGSNPALDGRYTVFGIVLEGLDLVKQLKAGSNNVDSGKVRDPDYILSAKVFKAK